MLPVGVRVAVRLVEGDNTIPLPVYQVHADSIAPLRSRRRPPSRRRGSQTWRPSRNRGFVGTATRVVRGVPVAPSLSRLTGDSKGALGAAWSHVPIHGNQMK